MNGYGLYIDGEWRDSLSGQTFQTTNPATGEILATFPKGAGEDVHKAIEAAEKAWPNWRNYPPPKRGEILLEAGVHEAETIVALTDRDQVNILASVLAKKEGCQRALCLINDRAYSSLSEGLGIDAFIDPRATTDRCPGTDPS